jgi:sugar phosphate isomerase/epimerase
VFTFPVMTAHTPVSAPLSRRDFLAATAVIPVLLAAGPLAVSTRAAEPVVPPRPNRKYPIGLELYSVRTELARNPQETLRRVAGMGYQAVEFYAPYASWTFPFAKEIRALMDDLGLRCFSTHNHIGSLTPGAGLDGAIELNQILGTRCLVLATAPQETAGLEGWKAIAGKLSAAVELLKPHGLSAGYHNHQAEWAPLDGGRRIMDVLAAETPPEFTLQLDVGTCVEAGGDPVAWIRSNPGRIRSIHLKDWAPGPDADNKGYRVLFGEGVAPWAEIIAAAESVGGVEYYLMEQEGSRFPEFETAERCLARWKALRGKE